MTNTPASKIVFFGVLTLALSRGCLLQSAPAYEVSGIVVDSRSQAPLANMLVSIAPTTARDQKQEQVTKPDGRFAFSAGEPGKYSLRVRKPGYPAQAYRQTGFAGVSSAIVVGDDQDTRNIVFEASRGCAISGLIKDENFEPVGNALVSVFQSTVSAGERKIISRRQARANAAGEFRLASLPPGNYYVCAMGRPWFADQVIQLQRLQKSMESRPSIDHGTVPSEPDADDQPSTQEQQIPEYSPDPSLRGTSFVTTFYANAPTLDDAAMVHVDAGSEAQVSITLPLAKAVSVRGSIIAPGEPSDGRANLYKKISDSFMIFLHTWVSKNGSFRFDNVPAGSYAIAASSQASSGPSSWNIRQEIEVGGSDLEVTLRPQPMGSLSGHVVFESERPSSAANLYVTFRNERNNSYRAEVGPDWNFSIHRLPAGKYEVVAAGAKDYVAAYLTGGAGERWPLTLDISSAETMRRDLMLTKAASAIDGTVEHAGLPQVGVLVLLMPKDPAQRWAYRVDQTDTDGSFHLATIPSGDYSLIALSQGAEIAYRDPKVAAVLAAASKQIHVDPSAQLDMKLEMVAAASLSLPSR